MAIRAGGCHAFYTRSAIFFMQSLKRFYQLIAPIGCTLANGFHGFYTNADRPHAGRGMDKRSVQQLRCFYDALSNYFQHVSIGMLALTYAGYTALFVTFIISSNWLKNYCSSAGDRR
jgi:putative ATP-binding cassette transporter